MNTRKSKSYCKSLSTCAQEILSTVKIVTPTYLSSLSSPCNLFSCQLHLLTVFAPSGVKKSSEKLSTVKCRWFLRKQFSRMMGVVKESRKKKKKKKLDYLLSELDCRYTSEALLLSLVRLYKGRFIFRIMLVYWRPEKWWFLWIVTCFLSG